MKWIPALLCMIFISCASLNNRIKFSDETPLKLIGKYELPHDLKFLNTTVGGLSGIDYDRKNNVYFLICDDRSATNPARFYKAKISITEKGIDSINFLDAVYLKQPGGRLYPGVKEDPMKTPDPESIRVDPNKNLLVWTNEGERIVKKEDTVLTDPGVIVMDLQGNFVDSFIIPSNMHMRSIASGPRQNGSFEGITFTKHYKRLLVSMEEPLYEDGARAGLKDSSAIIRMIEFNVRKRKAVAQYAYSVDPVAIAPVPPGAFQINGVSEILWINDDKLLVIERSYSVGTKASTIKIFLADLKAVPDISSYRSIQNIQVPFIKKKLLLNMDTLGIYIDNIEGITLGPILPNGHASVIIVADNNFSKDQVSQFFLFEIEE